MIDKSVIKRLAIQCGFTQTDRIGYYYAGIGDIEDFAQAVIENYKAGLVPVACMYVNHDDECEEIGHLDNYVGLVPDEFTPLYALKETK